MITFYHFRSNYVPSEGEGMYSSFNSNNNKKRKSQFSENSTYFSIHVHIHYKILTINFIFVSDCSHFRLTVLFVSFPAILADRWSQIMILNKNIADLDWSTYNFHGR